MNYPIKSTDIANGLASDDEQATLIVVEAILDDTYEEIALADESMREAILEKVSNWSDFAQYSNLISLQKALLSRPFSDNQNSTDENLIDESVLSASQEIAQNAVVEIGKTKRNRARNTMFSAVAAAALVALLFIGVSANLQDQNSATEISAVRSSSQTDKKSVEADSTTEEKSGTQLEDSFTNSGSEPIDQVIKPETNVRSEESSSSVPATNSVNKSSSEGTSSSLSSIQIVGAFVLAAILFAIATAFIKRRKNRNSN